MKELNEHYERNRNNYDIRGESYLEYYREKYPESYELLKNQDNER